MDLKFLPTSPGCYLFYDKSDEVIYVGKAKNIKRRVSTYFNKKHEDAKTIVLVSQIERVDFIITNTEVEALILESHLIKKHKPKYNILLKDDKKYPYFLITDEDFPRISVIRKKNLNPEKGHYYGPYTDARAMWATLDFLKKVFPLKQCKTMKKKPCLYSQIGRCMAPCSGKVTSAEYKALVAQVELFLSGKQSELLKHLMAQIQIYSDSQQYEKAAKLRDSYLDLKKTLEKQKVVYENARLNEDVVSMLHDKGIYVFVILMIREGRLIDKKEFVYEGDADFETFFREYYGSLSTALPDKIIVKELKEKSLYEQWLKVKISHNKELLALADKNAQAALDNAKLKRAVKIRDDFNEIGTYLKKQLKLKNFPHRIECYDISHIGGTNTVASMVVFINGLSKKSAYKKFKIKSTEGKPDDFASMQEVLSRRLARLRETEAHPNNSNAKVGRASWEKPDLIIIDGGKGQLSSVAGLIPEGIDVVSLAKKQEEVFLVGKSKPVILPRNSGALFLFQRIRDEAHRFAITFHKQLRAKDMLKSV